ncbi:MAG: protein kinase domain-containing protein [Cetobacterium sp.]
MNTEMIKIGCGNYARVYKQKLNDKYVAIKVPRSKLTKKEAYKYSKLEVRMLKKFKNSKYIINLVSHRLNDDENTLIFELLGNEVFDIIEHYNDRDEKIPVTVVKHITSCILHGLVELKNANILHNDLKPQNILFSKKLPKIFNKGYKNTVYKNLLRFDFINIIKSIFTVANDKLLEKILKESIVRRYNLHREILLLNNNAKISDLGNSFDEPAKISKLKDYSTLCAPTCNYKPPECILGLPHWIEADMWSLACIVYELLTGRLLFEVDRDNNMGIYSFHLLKIMELIGAVPTNMVQTGKYSKRYFINSIHRFNYLFDTTRDLTDLLTRKMFPVNHIISETDKKLIKDVERFLLKILVYESDKRITSIDALKDPFLSKDISILFLN